MAQLFDGKLVDYTRFLACLPEVDIVIASSGAPHYIIVRDDMKKVIEARRNKPMFLIDIAVPRNIEPSVNELDNVFLYDIDDLQKVVETNLKGRQNSAEAGRSHYRRRSGAHGGAAEGARSGAHHREPAGAAGAMCARPKWRACARKLGALTPEQEQALEALTKSIINKIAHGPISELRRHAAEPDGHHFISRHSKGLSA